MSGLGSTVDHLQALRRKFDAMLAAAKRKSARPDIGPSPPPAELRDIASFGSNPGNLRMLVHVPNGVSANPPVVVALHGCSQSAADYQRGTGWSHLADRYGFIVVYPEQQSANNAQSCFSWFQPGDIARDRGECLSVRQMVDYAITHFHGDPRKVFVTGLSAGGAMANAMLAAYPDVFASGAIIAGLPYACAGSVQQALEAMFSDQSPSTRTLVDRVRNASPHQGPWPTISVWHGTADALVKPSNGEHVVHQWLGVHGITTDAVVDVLPGGHRRRVWNDPAGKQQIEAITVAGMAHGVPIASSSGYGAPAPFFLDGALSSTEHIARFWGLDKATGRREASAPKRTPLVPIADAHPALAAARVAARTPAAAAPPPAPSLHNPNFDPAAVIAAAFKAAGLSPPDKANPGSPLDPKSVIKSALQAAGLLPK